ncbi:hypothetical protein V5O48_015590 [Marasmius crinis-equi]|uniref:NmrA-like domain-containing protein n=1 Tax=Marasmius crinis-equi TaxID=585013 RepID=A0ABR3EU41_9AGAR
MSSQPKTTVLVTGATGYIGGSVLNRLLTLPDAQSKYEFRAVVRNAEKAKKLADGFGVRPVIGSHSDKELMSKEAAEADVIVAMADCDDLDAATAINAGMKKRFEATGKRPILIHTSGTGVIVDNALGEYTSDFIWDDENVAQIAESIPPNALHRAPELKVFSADEEGYAKTYIVCPSIIYGAAHHPLVDAGIANSRTMIFKMLVSMAVKRGYGVTVGKGENVWANVHIDEVADLFVLLFTSILKDSNKIPHGKEGYFFAGADEHKNVQEYSEVAKTLFDLGKVKSAELTPLTGEEAKEFFGDYAALYLAALGGNARCVSNRAKKLGWRPKRTTKDFIGSIKDEIEYLVDAL